MLRKIMISALLCIIPAIAWLAYQHGDIQPITFASALRQSENHSDAEQSPKIRIDAICVNDAGHSADKNAGSFYARDNQGAVFMVNYTGKDPLPEVVDGKNISVIGHVHGGDPAYVHASQIIVR
jgi:hypothetical protein